MQIPISKELALKLFPQLEPNTPGAENPVGEGVIVDPQISIAVSLKRIANSLESIISHQYDEPAIRTRKN
jgi:hypothetical protein